jgi:hypothetical protein
MQSVQTRTFHEASGRDLTGFALTPVLYLNSLSKDFQTNGNFFARSGIIASERNS